jgi:hypothetical protein
LKAQPRSNACIACNECNDEETRALLLSIDPLAELAVNQEQLQTRLLELTPVISPDLRAMWEAAAAAAIGLPPDASGPDGGANFTHQFYVLITCRDEKHQVELLQRFQTEGLECQAKLC